VTGSASDRSDPLVGLLGQGGRRRRIAATAIGALAFVAAAVALAWNRETLAAALAALRAAPPGTVVLLLGAIAGQAVASCVLFAVLYRRYARIPAGAMAATVVASTAANYLPLRPGLVGRIAFLRARFGVGVRDSVVVTVEAIALGGIVLAVTVPVVGFARPIGYPAWIAVGTIAAAVSCLAAWRTSRRFALAFLVRLAELGLLAVRAWLSFRLIGLEISPESAIAFACVSSIASLVPLVPAGMGLREWAIGLLAPAVAGHSLGQGIAAELVNRAAELLVIAPLGGIAAAWLARPVRSSRPDPVP